MYRYNTHGTCSRQIEIEMDGDTVRSVRFIGGCTGNTQGLSRLVEGMQADEVIRRLKGIQCRAGTSCPDQLARALERIRTQA
ncbi:MAG TPA: TIGR03905 family TSCPD domain-containing protein [Candidatus Pullichristensenella stercorigallinarum]|uniref:ribonucleoside-diphosphate reductase n=1 Tax=Candidatus Pullichristensenella stercorigallinarum TaxID=2840909 RepID=A0A9D0ZNC6_9FIRM|nr:TIGR03905 family TSCPD domain-containing protein [Candidatus Pullichristensenella stercorigallinarum]